MSEPGGRTTLLTKDTCTHPDTEAIHAFGSPKPVRVFCTHCGATVYPPPRAFSWLRQVRPLPSPLVEPNGSPRVRDAYEKVDGPAVWDGGGRFVVIDTVTDGLEYAVLDTATDTAVRLVPFDLDDAIGWARDYEQAAQRMTQDAEVR